MASEILLVNPRRRRRRKVAAKTAPKRRRTASRRAPVRRRKVATVRRRARRNPIRIGGGLGTDLQTAFGGALGGLGLSVALGFLPIPANLKAGPLGYATKGALAFGLGMLARNFRLVRPATAQRLTEGALTVVMYEVLRDATQQFAPQVPLGGVGMYMTDPALGYYGSGWNPENNDIGMYLPNFSSVPDASLFDGVGYGSEVTGY